MECPQIFIHAFGNVYNLSSNFLYKSNMLSSAVSESILQDCIIDLNLDQRYQTAFEYIYNRLIEQPVNLDQLILSDVLVLADYLEINFIIEEILPIIIPMRGNLIDQHVINVFNNIILKAT
jgi:hypothetical protein